MNKIGSDKKRFTYKTCKTKIEPAVLVTDLVGSLTMESDGTVMASWRHTKVHPFTCFCGKANLLIC